MEKINFNKVIDPILTNNVIKATLYLSPTRVVRATRIRYNKKILRGGGANIYLMVGTPNYLERHFIKLCKKAKEPFPIKKVQLKLYVKPPRTSSRSK